MMAWEAVSAGSGGSPGGSQAAASAAAQEEPAAAPGLPSRRCRICRMCMRMQLRCESCWGLIQRIQNPGGALARRPQQIWLGKP